MISLAIAGRCSLWTGLLILILTCYGCANEDHSKLFEEVTIASGITNSGMTFGASWGDFNGDGLPDLYTTNHGNPAALYQNLGEGRFKDVTTDFFSPVDLEGDKHGATWVDYDNDGDKDLLLLRGGGRGVGVGPNSFFINSGNGFEESAAKLGIDNAHARTRMQLFNDFDNDGYIDVFLGALARSDGKAPASIFVQKNGLFKLSPNYEPFASASVPFCILAMLNINKSHELICRVQGAKDRAGQIFNMANSQLKELDILPKTHFDDVAAGDFDGDLKMDLYLARKKPDGPVIFGRRGDNEIIIDFKVALKDVKMEVGAEFETAGEITVEVLSAPTASLLPPENIYIGSEGLTPLKRSFVLNQDVAGIEQNRPYIPGENFGLYIYRLTDNTWQINVSGDAKWAAANQYDPLQITVKITSTKKITKLKSQRSEIEPQFAADRLLMNVNDGFKREGDARGINEPQMDSSNVVAGDFDNDMDLDLYVVSSSSVENMENKLLLNNGDGYFFPVKRAGGAPGTHKGVGDAVAMADYDQDGFLDLLVMNGGSMGRSYGLAANDGGYQLYHNIGNDNHWLEIDLEGTQSNRDGVGAVVYVTAGGVTQMRIQDGGVHNRVQNHQRLHFGLARNKIIDNITIKWPSGTVQELSNIKVDQLLHIKESGTKTVQR